VIVRLHIRGSHRAARHKQSRPVLLDTWQGRSLAAAACKTKGHKHSGTEEFRTTT
jgi:hypothetical protein